MSLFTVDGIKNLTPEARIGKIADSAFNMAADVSSDEEYQSAPEGEGDEETDDRRIKSATCAGEDEADQKLMTQLHSMDVKSEPADNDRTSRSTSADGGQTNRDSEECGAKMMSSLDNRYVSEEHAPEKDGAVELTEEQIKVNHNSSGHTDHERDHSLKFWAFIA